MSIQRSTVPLTAISILAAALVGCLRIQAASPLRLTEPGPGTPAQAPAPTESNQTWPKRWSATDARGVIVPIKGPLNRWNGVRLGPEHYLRSNDDDRADAEAVAELADTKQGFQYVLEGPGSFIFRHEPEVPGRSTASDPDEMFKFVSGREVGGIQGLTLVSIERTWMAYYDSATKKARGLIVIVPGLFGVPEPVNDRFVEICRSDGWAVLRLLSEPSRYTARTTFKIDAGDLEASAIPIAREFCDRAAETAYAVQAGVDHVLDLRPGLKDADHVLIGMSGGAMALSTVYAWAPDLYDAAVYIAGGSDFLSIVNESNYSDWIQSIELDWGDWKSDSRESESLVRAALMDKLNDAYLKHAPLDAYNLAPMLRDVPVLMIHGSNDRAVPSKYGDQLWERLGKPERWIFSAGHELIFFTLNGQTPRIVRWLDQTLQHDDQDGSE